MDRGAWQATVHGLARVRYNLATKQSTQQQRQIFTSYFKPVLNPTIYSIKMKQLRQGFSRILLSKRVGVVTLKRRMRPYYLNLYMHFHSS